MVKLKNLAHSIDEALGRFALVSGPGDGQTTACAMSLLAWMEGCHSWTDFPECAHPFIRSRVIEANDASGTTAVMRAELVRAGQKGILDTWWVPIQVILEAFSTPVGEDRPSQYDCTLMMVNNVAAWKKNKQRPNLTYADLTYADLRSANLRSANLTSANLTSANLTYADLTSANLRSANLRSANLRSANLRSANLRSANLRSANLTYANLRYANLTSANLTYADLTYADLTYAKANEYTVGIPQGWKINDSGLVVKA